MTLSLLKNYSYVRNAATLEDYDYIYLSPHFDDVAFSCSGTIYTTRAEGQHTLVVTLFASEPQPPFPPLAQACHQLWQIPEGASPYRIRKLEDEQAMSALGVDYLWLNWLELIYRIPDLSDLSQINDYQADFQHDPIFPTLCQWLADLQTTYPGATFVAPLGIGGHRDHGVVFQAVLSTLDHTRLRFFEDFPYVAYLPEEAAEQVNLYNLSPLEVDISHHLAQRIQVAGLYQSQHAMLFYPPSSFPDLIKEYTHAGKQSHFVERYWKFPQ
jgi:LmbE family N-acetylglucosaminyl deacetylase